MAERDYRFETNLIHAGEPRPLIEGAATLPIFQCAVFEHHGSRGYHDIRYPRLNNLPNHNVLADKLAALESGEAGLVTASGMAAIATTLLSVLGAGGHMLAQRGIYGGTHTFLTSDFADFGLGYDFIDGQRPEGWEAALRDNTRAIYVEAMTNPLLQVADHRAIVAFARRHGLISIIDNTFATPVNFRPLEIGYDLCVHSATKYLNGHADVAAGAIVGSASLVDKILHRLNHLGGTLDAHACFLFHRGLKTLGLRVERQNANALAIAEYLESRSEVATVNYPGLASHPQHGRARELFSGFGGMLSFELKGGALAANRLVERLQIPLNAPSLGGLETLIISPAQTSHAGLSETERQQIGITDGLLRFSVGIENADDLIADFAQALDDAAS